MLGAYDRKGGECLYVGELRGFVRLPFRKRQARQAAYLLTLPYPQASLRETSDSNGLIFFTIFV